MAGWSREQSQDANRRPISSGLKSRATGNLQSQSERQKQYNRRVKGIQKPFASTVGPIEIKPPKDRDFNAPMRADYKPPRLRGRSGSRLSPAKRAMVELRRDARAAFFASL